MYKVDINQKIFDSLGLSQNERLVFDALISYPMPNSVPKLMKMTGLPRSTVRDVVRRLAQRKLAEQVMWGKQTWWKYKRGLEQLGKYGIKHEAGK